MSDLYDQTGGMGWTSLVHDLQNICLCWRKGDNMSRVHMDSGENDQFTSL